MNVALPNPKVAVLNALSSYSEDIITFTSKLVSVPTENPPGKNYAQCVQLIANELDRLNLSYEVFSLPASTPKVESNYEDPQFLTTTYGTGEPTLYFHGHYDVVPASRTEQFNPRREGQKLVGRGSADMKSGLAAMIYALKAIKDSGAKLHGRVALNMVPDEETGGARGSKLLAQAGLLAKNALGMLTAEPSSGVVWNASRGALSLRITVKGKPAHVGLHFKGINAFERMLTVTKQLLDLKHEVEQRKTAFRIEPEAAQRSILLLGGVCSGGTNFNVVPDSVSFTIDRRTNPEENLEIEKKQLLDCLNESSRDGIDLEVEILQEGQAAGCSEDEPLAKALRRSVTEVTGKEPRFELCPGLLEIRYYASQGTPALAYGPGLLSVSHGPHEFVVTKNIIDCARIYALTALYMLGEKSGN